MYNKQLIHGTDGEILVQDNDTGRTHTASTNDVKFHTMFTSVRDAVIALRDVAANMDDNSETDCELMERTIEELQAQFTDTDIFMAHSVIGSVFDVININAE